MHSARSGGGQRFYSEAEVARVHLIQRLLDAADSSRPGTRWTP
ncbi:MerR family transcriptional regulator [Streptomyces liangshanensis]